MEAQTAEIGERIRSHIRPGLSQRQLAAMVGMTPDSLSRALNGQRGFASIELAKISEVLGADVHWLITGHIDPLRVDVAARHAWDPLRAQRVNPGRGSDEQILREVVTAYREAFSDGPPPSQQLAQSPEHLRGELGDGFARWFAELVEQRLAVDVVRVQGLSTDYSLRIGERGVVLLASTPNWFRSNWSLAHEIGHLALGHHAGSASAHVNERPANDFAAELLLPARLVREFDWSGLSVAQLARFIWDAGVSTEVVRNRLRYLKVGLPDLLAQALECKTQSLLRQHVDVLDDGGGFGDPLTMREREAAARRFPLVLLTALRERVEAGQADPRRLAWVLDVPIDEIDFPEPDEETSAVVYGRMLEDRPDPTEWQRRLAGRPTTEG